MCLLACEYWVGYLLFCVNCEHQIIAFSLFDVKPTSGEACDTYNGCHDGPCQNGGTCTDAEDNGENQYTCEYVGGDCQVCTIWLFAQMISKISFCMFLTLSAGRFCTSQTMKIIYKLKDDSIPGNRETAFVFISYKENGTREMSYKQYKLLFIV